MDDISNIMFSLDVSKAVATKEADAEKIKASIAEQTGIDEFNEVLKQALAEGLAALPAVMSMTGACSFQKIGAVALLAGKVLDRQGSYVKAVAMSRFAVSIFEQFASPDAGIKTAEALNNLGLSQYNAGMNIESAETHQRALKMREQLLGPDHPDVASSCNNLSLLKLAEHKLDEAEDLQKRALRIKELEFGPDSEKIAPILNSLGRVMQQRGNLDEAENTFSKALVIFTNNLGQSHPFTRTSIYYLGEVFEARVKLKQATD